jgi:hypothetical protein
VDIAVAGGGPGIGEDVVDRLAEVLLGAMRSNRGLMEWVLE